MGISWKSGNNPHNRFLEKIRENVTTSFYCRYNYALQLRNIGDGSEMVYYKPKQRLKLDK